MTLASSSTVWPTLEQSASEPWKNMWTGSHHGTWGVIHVQFGNGNWKMRHRAVAEVASKLAIAELGEAPCEKV